jgi:hypothetical protein
LVGLLPRGDVGCLAFTARVTLGAALRPAVDLVARDATLDFESPFIIGSCVLNVKDGSPFLFGFARFRQGDGHGLLLRLAMLHLGANVRANRFP